MLANIFKYVQLALAAVVVVEQTKAADAGATKQQTAIDLITNESQVLGVAFPNQQALSGSIVNMAVGAFNLIGLFQHAKTPAKT